MDYLSESSQLIWLLLFCPLHTHEETKAFKTLKGSVSPRTSMEHILCAHVRVRVCLCMRVCVRVCVWWGGLEEV